MIALELGAVLMGAAWVVVVPGLLVADLALPGCDGAERLAVGLALGLGLVPVAAFGASMLLGTVPSRGLLLALATITNLALALVRRRRFLPSEPGALA